jgi:hypothetical protein
MQEWQIVGFDAHKIIHRTCLLDLSIFVKSFNFKALSDVEKKLTTFIAAGA